MGQVGGRAISKPESYGIRETADKMISRKYALLLRQTCKSQKNIFSLVPLFRNKYLAIIRGYSPSPDSINRARVTALAPRRMVK